MITVPRPGGRLQSGTALLTGTQVCPVIIAGGQAAVRCNNRAVPPYTGVSGGRSETSPPAGAGLQSHGAAQVCLLLRSVTH